VRERKRERERRRRREGERENWCVCRNESGVENDSSNLVLYTQSACHPPYSRGGTNLIYYVCVFMHIYVYIAEKQCNGICNRFRKT
jgi:hypothetical protein